MFVYCLYDLVSGLHGPLFEQPNIGAARRSCRRMRIDDQEPNWSDYQIVVYGERDSHGVMHCDPDEVRYVPVIEEIEVEDEARRASLHDDVYLAGIRKFEQDQRDLADEKADFLHDIGVD